MRRSSGEEEGSGCGWLQGAGGRGASAASEAATVQLLMCAAGRQAGRPAATAGSRRQRRMATCLPAGWPAGHPTLSSISSHTHSLPQGSTLPCKGAQHGHLPAGYPTLSGPSTIPGGSPLPCCLATSWAPPLLRVLRRAPLSQSTCNQHVICCCILTGRQAGGGCGAPQSRTQCFLCLGGCSMSPLSPAYLTQVYAMPASTMCGKLTFLNTVLTGAITSTC